MSRIKIEEINNRRAMEDNAKKHILIVTDAWHPQNNGVVRTLSNVKEQFEKMGHEVSVITPERSVTVSMPKYKEIRLSLFPKWGKKWVGSEIEELNPDQIYIATEGPLGSAAMKHCNKQGLDYVTGFHTKFHEFAKAFGVPGGEAIGLYFLKRFHKNSSAIMAPTQTVADELKELGLEQAKPWTRGVNLEQFHPGPSDVYADMKKPIFLNVGRVSYEKGLDDFLQQDLPGTKVVVGDGPALEKLKKAYPDAVFVGKKKGKELADHYRGADVFVFPSRSDTFGNVQTEAMACGVPAVAYASTPSKDIIRDPRVGVLAEDGKLKEACMDALKLKEQGCEDACHAYIKEHYTWENTARLLAANLVDAKPPKAVDKKTPDGSKAFTFDDETHHDISKDGSLAKLKEEWNQRVHGDGTVPPEMGR